MRENLIKLDIFDVLAVTSYEAKHEVGKHGRAIIRAIIEEKREEEYINTAQNTRWVRVNALDETDKESTIFYGLLEKICFFNCSNITDRSSYIMFYLFKTTNGTRDEKYGV